MSQEIPLRNLWILFLYAADLVQFNGRFDHEVEAARDLPEMIARVLAHVVEDRLKRNLSRGYQPRAAVFSRVRGRIDMLKTESQRLMERGQVACRFEEHWMNTPRNRLVRAALVRLSVRVRAQDVARRCRQIAGAIGRFGVDDIKPSRAELAQDQIGVNEAQDRFMVALARMVFNSDLPNQEDGQIKGTLPEASVHLVRKLFQRAVCNAMKLELTPLGWQVWGGRKIAWPVVAASSGLKAILPGMETDIELTHREYNRRIIIDTKFTSLLTSSRFEREVLKSGYLYQLYTYLRSQERDTDPLSLSARGMLLHPQIGGAYDEWVELQGHVLHFKTVDLTLDAAGFEASLRKLVDTEVR